MKSFVTIVMATLLLAIGAIGQVNYTFSTSSETFTGLSSPSQFTWTTTSANDEEYSAVTNIYDGAETFTYAGTAFTSFQVSTNGFIKLGSGLASATSTDALSGTTRSIIAPLWDNLAVSTTVDDITYKVDGTSGSYVLTVEWRNVKWNSTAGSANAEFQVKLYQATGNIEFIYGTMTTPTAGSASIGLADNTAITVTTNPSTGKFLSINVGGTSGSRVYHQSRAMIFNAINNAPDANTKFTFTAVTPSALTAGTYTVGTGQTYPTISQAAQAVSINGVSGAVVFEIANGTYDDILHLTNISGASESNTVTFKPATGATVTLTPMNGSVNSTTAAAFADAIVRLAGTQYVTIDGLRLHEAAQATATLRFEFGVGAGNSVNTDGSMAVGCRFNTFKNLSIDLKGTTGVAHAGLVGLRYFTTGSSETDTSKATSYNLIDTCTITGFWRAGWKNFGISGTNPDRGNTIRRSTLGNNTIASGTSSDCRALEMDVQMNLTIENNIIENIISSVMTTNNIYGVWLNPASSGTNLNSGTIIIRNNTIRNLENTNASSTTGFAVGIASNNVATSTEIQAYNNVIYDVYANGNGASRAIGIGLYVSTGTGVTSKIYNNMISDLRAPRSTSAPSVRALDLQNAAGTATFIVYHNTVNLDDAVPPSISAHNSAGMYIANMGTGSIDLRNNIFINTMSSTTGKAACLMPSANSNYLRLASTSDYNLYYSGASPSGTQGVSWDFTTLRQSLADHQSAVATGGLGGPRDVNAKSAAVTFVNSLSNLKLAGGSIGDGTNLTASVISSPYNLDFEGDTRHASFPYKGADENTSTALPVELTSFTAVANGKNVELKWTTATEQNNHGFDVERMSNGAWSKIGFVQGAGNSNAPKAYSYSDAGLSNGTVLYRLKQIDRDGKFTYNNAIEVVVNATVSRYELSQNFPNPFNPTTTIRFALPTAEQASVKVYDMTGREVAELFNQVAAAGQVYNVQFTGTGLASGIYLYVLQTQSYREVRKMSLLK